MLRSWLACVVMSLVSAAPAFAQARMAAPEIKVAGQGRNQRDCVKDAEGKALEAAIPGIVDQEPTVAGASARCMATALQGKVTLKAGRARMAANSCEVPFTVAYERAGVLAAGRKCMRTEISAPVGIVLRAEVARPGEESPSADANLTQDAIGAVADGLGRANFEIVSLPQFQKDFLDLRLIVGQCAFTGDARAPDWSDDCKRRFDDYTAARDALANRLSDAVAVTPSLRGWRECGGLFVSGEVRITPGSESVQGAINVDYYALAGNVTLIAPFTDSRPVRIDLGGEVDAVSKAIAELSAAVVKDATQKLSRFAHSSGCVPPKA